MDIVCQQCGDLGYIDLLVYCSLCHEAAKHQYCMDTILNSDENVKWSCEYCNLSSMELSHVTASQGAKIIKNNNGLLVNPKACFFHDRKKHVISNNNKMISSKKCVHDASVSHGSRSRLNLHSLKNHERKDRRKSNKSIIKCREHTLKGYVDPLRNKGAILQPFKWSKSYGHRRKLVLPNEDDDSINDTKKGVKIGSPLEIKNDVLQNTIPLHQSFKNDKPNAHRRKLVLSDEEVGSLHDLEVGSLHDPFALALQVTDDEMITNTKSGGDSMKSFDNSTGVDEHFQNLASQNVQEFTGSQSEFCFISAMPIRSYSWRGLFEIGGSTYGPLTAHLSTKVGEKAMNATRSLPPVIQLTRVSKSHAWPKSFGNSPPTDDHIALFFFPLDSGVEMVDQLLEEVINHDLVLKVVLDEAEMLIFPSVLLPKDHKTFQDKYYLWGVFKRKDSITNSGEMIRIQETDENSAKQRAHELSIKHIDEEILLKEEDQQECLSYLTDEGGDEEKAGDYGKDEEINGCLNLFPMQVENIALLKTGEGKKGVDLELGLGLPYRQ